jgi:lipoprotein-anchoring transpeptidase ErfK/SrfK
MKPNQRHNNLQRYLLIALLLALAPFATAQNTPSEEVAPRRRVLISIPDRKLAVLENDTVIQVFPVAVGADTSPSPSGDFEISSRVSHPTYYHPGVVIPAGKDNPIGTRWVGLNKPGYGIHGTNVPSSIGQAASHGCIRMGNRDVEKFFAMVRIGDTVQILVEPNEESASIFAEQEAPAAVVQAEGASAGGSQ